MEKKINHGKNTLFELETHKILQELIKKCKEINRTGKLCYVASPYKGLYPEIAISIAKEGAKRAKELGLIPVSPVLCFNGVYKEEDERDVVLDAGLKILKQCDILAFVDTKYSKSRKGMGIELALAKFMEKEIITIRINNYGN